MIFFNLAASEIDVEHGVGLALGLVAMAIAATLVWLVASRVLRLAPRRRPAPSSRAVLCVNTGYLGYPLTVALLGRDELSTAVLYDIARQRPLAAARRLRRRRRLRDQGR